MHTTAVLIVGAGPTGLMTACQLALLKIPFIIVEKASGPTTESRALGIQARTLEIFSQMGIVDSFLKDGEKASGLNFMAEGKIIQHIPLSGLGKGLTAFPFLLIHEQSKTESILLSFLRQHGHDVQWSTEVASFTQNSDTVTTILRDKTGKERTITSDWIIGADGAHSIVRHTLKIPLKGKTYKQSLFVLDCKISSVLSPENITVASSAVTFAAFFPMTNNRWRIVGQVPDSSFGKDDITFEEVQKDFGERLKIDMTLSDPAWISLYHAHHRCVEHFSEGKAYLMGDAANIHSPIGAQGMNTGLQDAYNLAWKLAFVHQKKAKKVLLATYNAERLPVAQKLVATTDRLFNLFVSGKRIAVLVRERLLPLFIKHVVSHKKTGKVAFRLVSQIGIRYHNSPLSENASSGEFPNTAPRPGDRLPHVAYMENNKVKNIQDIITPVKMQLVIFSGANHRRLSLQDIVKRFEKSIDITEIPKSQESGELYKRFGVNEFGYLLIRPDMYIAYRSNTHDPDHFQQYLARFFVPNPLNKTTATT